MWVDENFGRSDGCVMITLGHEYSGNVAAAAEVKSGSCRMVLLLLLLLLLLLIN